MYLNITKTFTFLMGSISKRYNLAVFEFLSINGKSDKRPFLVPPLYSGSSRVDVQEVKRLVVFHFQYMTVSANEQLRRHGINL